MKTQKSNSLNQLVILVLIVLLLPACGNTNQDESTVKKPDVDIHTAVLTGDLSLVRQHIEAGTDLNEKEPFNGSTPLISAATFGKTEIAKALIEAGADHSLKNNDGSTALFSAAFFCRVEIVNILLDANADKTLLNSYGATARESVMGPFNDVKPIYQFMQQQLAPLGMQLDLERIEKTRPVIAMMLQ